MRYLLSAEIEMKDFTNKVVVITGAGSGIGRATAKAFSSQGARVHLVDIRKERLEEACAEILSLGGVAIPGTRCPGTRCQPNSCQR